ncbi:helix-turn-helix domain-containing protein [Parabacteroides goldsteinii]|uniref:helix-turn-helix domain-containing protein n=1 Tax=Parabacteroides goldsteinii TaxID=328812 RepID=UPI00259B87F7|nr:helix-turn-helix transcriptional regulator [Parabacteroides goldsteinii]
MPKKNKDLAIEIGHRICKCRKSRGWKQQELADHTGLSQQFIACVERGAKGLGFDSIIKMSYALDTSTDYLLTGATPPSEANYVQSLLAIMNESQRQATVEVIEKILIACGYKLPQN